VVIFGLLYAASPKTFAADADFAPVPWALGIYFVFTIIRLLLAYRGSVGPLMLYTSIVLDMCLLLGLIWSFHLQYQPPPSFYLKSPTLLYVFIFIALRALRFEARGRPCRRGGLDRACILRDLYHRYRNGDPRLCLLHDQ
jgi:adenylate cyclase